MEDHQVKCYINLLEYKAYTYQNGKAAPVPLPDMGHRLDGLRTAINEAVAETSEELWKSTSPARILPPTSVHGHCFRRA